MSRKTNEGLPDLAAPGPTPDEIAARVEGAMEQAARNGTTTGYAAELLGNFIGCVEKGRTLDAGDCKGARFALDLLERRERAQASEIAELTSANERIEIAGGGKSYVVTVQRGGRPSPHDFRQAAEARATRAEAALAETTWKPIAEAKPGSGGLVLGNPDGVYVSGSMPDKWVRGFIREDGTAWDDDGFPLKASYFLVPPLLPASQALAADSLMERPRDPSAFHEGEQFGQIVGVDQSHPDLRGVVDEGGVSGLHVEDRPTSSFSVGANVVLGHDGKVDRSQTGDHGANEVAP